MWSLFFLPLFPTSPDITAPDLSSGLRGRVGKGRGERLINISTARLLGGLIHTLPIFHPPPTYSHPSLFRMCKGSPNKAVLNSESTWLVAGGILSLKCRVQAQDWARGWEEGVQEGEEMLFILGLEAVGVRQRKKVQEPSFGSHLLG